MPSVIAPNIVQLCLETSGHGGSLAILEGKKVAWSLDFPPQNRAAAAIGPALEQALNWSSENEKPFQYLSVAEGPGSFTGLRIAITAAKTLAYAMAIPVVAVDSLAAIGMNVLNQVQAGEVLVGVNAYRGQVFTCQLSNPDLESSALVNDSTVSDANEWKTKLEHLSKSPSFLRDQLVLAGEEKVFQVFEPDLFLPKLVKRKEPDAVGVGLLGLIKIQQQLFGDPLSLAPKYIKLSAAEEKQLVSEKTTDS